jgi:CheY-like chemotaxis protein
MEEIPAPFQTHVIVADDEDLYRRVLGRELSRRGCRVSACALPDEAARVWQAAIRAGERPTLVVDLIQPGDGEGCLGGLDLLRRLQPLAAREVLAVCESEAEWLREAARSLGATRVVSKPDLRRLEPEHLDRALRRFAAQVAGEPVSEPDAEDSQGAATEAPTALPGAGPLLGALEELQHVRERQAILLLVMRFASELAARGMLLDVQGDSLRLLGCFGGTAGVAASLPLDRDSLPARAFWSARAQRLASPTAAALPPGLPGPAPGEALAVPVPGADGIEAVIYADSGRPGQGLPDMRPLTALAATARLALSAGASRRRADRSAAV